MILTCTVPIVDVRSSTLQSDLLLPLCKESQAFFPRAQPAVIPAPAQGSHTQNSLHTTRAFHVRAAGDRSPALNHFADARSGFEGRRESSETLLRWRRPAARLSGLAFASVSLGCCCDGAKREARRRGHGAGMAVETNGLQQRGKGNTTEHTRCRPVARASNDGQSNKADIGAGLGKGSCSVSLERPRTSPSAEQREAGGGERGNRGRSVTHNVKVVFSASDALVAIRFGHGAVERAVVLSRDFAKVDHVVAVLSAVHVRLVDLCRLGQFAVLLQLAGLVGRVLLDHVGLAVLEVSEREEDNVALVDPDLRAFPESVAAAAAWSAE